MVDESGAGGQDKGAVPEIEIIRDILLKDLQRAHDVRMEKIEQQLSALSAALDSKFSAAVARIEAVAAGTGESQKQALLQIAHAITQIASGKSLHFGSAESDGAGSAHLSSLEGDSTAAIHSGGPGDSAGSVHLSSAESDSAAVAHSGSAEGDSAGTVYLSAPEGDSAGGVHLSSLEGDNAGKAGEGEPSNDGS